MANPTDDLHPEFTPDELDVMCLNWTGRFNNNDPRHLDAARSLYPKLFKARQARPEHERLKMFDARDRIAAIEKARPKT